MGPFSWNAWADGLGEDDPFQALFKPEGSLEPEKRYAVTVDLASQTYGTSGVVSTGTGPVFGKLLQKLLDGTADTVSLTPVLLTDPRFFETPSQALAPMVIDLDHIRDFYRSGGATVDDPIRQFREGEEVDILFGRLQFELKTGNREGAATVGLSFWSEGRPVDEISITFCIRGRDSEGCLDLAADIVSLQGFLMFDLAAGESQSPPKPGAALHIIELPGEGLFGVFRRNGGSTPPTVGDYHTWQVSARSGSFIQELSQIQSNFARVRGTPARVGQSLTNLLFPAGDPAANKAYEVFEEFVRPPTEATEPFQDDDPPVFFVRLVLADLTGPGLFPLSLMNLDDSESSFLGYRFRVETPLPRQRSPERGCVSSWVPVLPPSTQDAPLTDARRKMTDRLVEDPFGGTEFRLSEGKTVKAYMSMEEFLGWAGRGQEAADSVALAVVSHHTRNSLYFDSSISVVHARNVARMFSGPSLAVLSGCSTGELGASSVIEQLNNLGVQTVITTNTGISGNLAGDFMECLVQVVEDLPSGSTIAVGDAFYSAQRCLYGLEDGGESLYAHRVLSFTLSGDPSLQLCSQQ